MAPLVALKIDVDTERGTREGVPALVSLLEEHGIPACFLFSLGPDNTGKAVSRIFRPGFFSKVARTSVVKTYGVRTLLNGTLLPAPHIGRRHESILRDVRDRGFETGIHCHDHYHWQDHLFRLSREQVRAEFGRARAEYERIFGVAASTAGAPGWQASADSREVYDEADLLYSSDSRGRGPYFPEIGGRKFRTLEIPSTLPTFDELIGRPEFPQDRMVSLFESWLSPTQVNVFTLHAEIEGMLMRPLFVRVLRAWIDHGVKFVRMDDVARRVLACPGQVPFHGMEMREIDGRSGMVATQDAG